MAENTPESDLGSIECFQNYSAPEVFIQGLAGIVDQQDVESMIRAQKQICVFWGVWFLTLVYCDDEPVKGCVNHPISACPKVSSSSPCLCRMEIDFTYICCNITSEYQLKEGLSCAMLPQKPNQPGIKQPITALHILNSTLEKLDVGQTSFQKLIGLSVTESFIPRIMGSFPPSIMCLNLSSIHLIELDLKAFEHVPQLGYLDLSNNNLTIPPVLRFATFSKNHFFIDLSRNQNLSCKLLHEVKTQKNSSVNLNFMKENDTTCSMPSSYNWFNSVNVYSLNQLDSVYQLDLDCPRTADYNCSCQLARNVELTLHTGRGVMHNYVSVDCSSRGLTELPAALPPDTLLLNITNNSITHLNHLGNNKHYMSIIQIYADDNRIESITALEGSNFINNFIFLSLRNNNIKVIPKYLLSNVFDRNTFPRVVNLGMNRLPCDCNTAQVLKVWLLANKEHLTDYDQLLCENFNEMKVVDLDQSKVCVYPRDWTDYIYYIITLEIFLFALLISKVSYDYWVFKTTGSLPWPASKMPRLPCDWVFEM